MDSSNQNRQLVLIVKQSVFHQPEKEKGSLITPMVVFSVLLIAVVMLSFSTDKRVKIFLQGFDGIFFFLTGALGILLILMWIGTDHSMTKNNYNLLWAWPFNAIIAFFINSNKKWVIKVYRLFSGWFNDCVINLALFAPTNEQCVSTTCPITYFYKCPQIFYHGIINAGMG
jgi:hypothetical protein